MGFNDTFPFIYERLEDDVIKIELYAPCFLFSNLLSYNLHEIIHVELKYVYSYEERKHVCIQVNNLKSEELFEKLRRT
jgi:hypothetical protein